MGTFTYEADLFPGQRLNALAGIAPGGATTVFNQSLTSGFRAPVDQVVADAVPEECFFGPFPVLVPCRTWTALVEEFFSPFAFRGRPSSFAGAAVMQAHSRQAAAIRQELASRLGICEEDADDDADRSFVLVRVPRSIPDNTIHLPDPQTQPVWPFRRSR